MNKLLKILIKLVFVYRIKKLHPTWRSIIILKAKNKQECNDLAQIMAELPPKCIGETPVISIKEGCDITELNLLPEELLSKIREAVWE